MNFFKKHFIIVNFFLKSFFNIVYSKLFLKSFFNIVYSKLFLKSFFNIVYSKLFSKKEPLYVVNFFNVLIYHFLQLCSILSSVSKWGNYQVRGYPCQFHQIHEGR